MTTWDKIYKNYQKGGPAWKSLSQDILPAFKKFVESAGIPIKNALDIGCGDGRYLKYLQRLGFKTDGIDSSATSVEMTKKALKKASKIEIADMFRYGIAADKYGLIFCVNTIQHGRKEQAGSLIKKAYKALPRKGKIFFTFPDIKSASKWTTFKKSKKISSGTYAPLSGPEKGLPHSFFIKKEIKKMFLKFKNVKMEMDDRGRWYIQAEK